MGLWSFIKSAAESIVDGISTVVGGIFETFDSVFSWFGSALGFLKGLFFSIPFLGRLLNWIWNVILEFIWRLVGIFDFTLALIGILPEKKLRICTIVLSDTNGFLVSEIDAVNSLNNLISTFKSELNVRVICSCPFQYTTPFSAPNSANSDWVHMRAAISENDILDIYCDTGAAKEDLWTTGAKFELLSNTICFYGNARRFIGYGAPIVLFVVRSFKDGKLGCSLGPLVDYITASKDGILRDPSIIAHECGHACGLRHRDSDQANLMYPNAGRQTNLTKWQTAWARNSRHITYL